MPSYATYNYTQSLRNSDNILPEDAKQINADTTKLLQEVLKDPSKSKLTPKQILALNRMVKIKE